MIFIFGASGFLGNYLSAFLLKSGYQVESVCRNDLHHENGEWKIAEHLSHKLQDAATVINCIALTDLAECENNIEKSMIVNEKFPIHLSTLLPKSTHLIHLSSDAMYESKKNFSNENAEILISNIYAAHKLNAENCISNHFNATVLRTSFLGYNHRNSGMVNHLLDSLNQGKEIFGWNNAFTSSLHISHLSRIISLLIASPIRGIFNAGTLLPYSKFEFLESLATKLNHSVKVTPIMAPQNNKLLRNKNLGMDATKLLHELKFQGWTIDDVVRETYNEIKYLVKL